MALTFEKMLAQRVNVLREALEEVTTRFEPDEHGNISIGDQDLDYIRDILKENPKVHFGPNCPGTTKKHCSGWESPDCTGCIRSG